MSVIVQANIKHKLLALNILNHFADSNGFFYNITGVELVCCDTPVFFFREI